MNVEAIPYKSHEKEFMAYLSSPEEDNMYVGFECLKERYSFILGNCTDFTGHPASGKTEICLEFMFYLSETKGLRHAIYVPDIGNYKEIRRKLLQKHIRKYYRAFKDEDVINANAWVDHHFIILRRKDFKAPVSPMDIWEFTCTYKDDSGIVHTGMIDSWKNLFHDNKGREDLYNDNILSERNELAESQNKHFFTIAHPGKTEWDMKEKKRRIPDANDIKGGGWYASGKCIISVDYPDKTKNGANIYFSKIKPDTVGKVGKVEDLMFFDWAKSRYYELEPNYLNSRYYAGELAKKPKTEQLELKVEEPTQASLDDEWQEPPF